VAQDIFLYQDYVHSTAAIWSALCEMYGHTRVRQINANDIKAGVLDENTKAFIMPGGATRYVNAQLGKEGNQLIKNYIEKGGTYIGICAGAYYACARTEWDTGAQKIFTDNDLAFCDCVARGPISSLVNKQKNFPTAITHIRFDNGTTQKNLYWGGPVFEFRSKEAESKVEVLARYEDVDGKPIAAFTGRYGSGRYILTSVHLEVDTAQLHLMKMNVIDNRFEDIASLTDIENVSRKAFFDMVKRFVS
jgi:glutamine amidotransferase-like uncharacterized protein